MKNPSSCPWCKSETFIEEGAWFAANGNGEPIPPSTPCFQVQCSAPCAACGPTKDTEEEDIKAWDDLCMVVDLAAAGLFTASATGGPIT